MKPFILFISLILLLGCEKKTSSKPLVLVTIPPYAYFVERIGKEAIEVQTLVPQTANPHIFEPTPRQIEGATFSQIWFRIEEPFEQKILKVLQEQNPKMIIVDLLEGIPLISSAEDDQYQEDARDRHIWMSPKLAKDQVCLITQKLAELYPDQKLHFERNQASLLRDLEELDQEITHLLASSQGSAILTSHPAFGYFTRDYHLIQLSVECEGKDPLPKQIMQILKEAQEKKTRLILTQPQYNNKGAELIAEKLHLPIYVVDPYSHDYLINMHDLAKVIATP